MQIKKILLIELIVFTFLLGFFSSAVLKQNITSSAYAEETDPDRIKQVAENYLTAAPYSKRGLTEALCKYEHFDRKAAADVVGKLSVDWQEQADREVEEYLNMDGHSEKSIREFLERDFFTEKQIDKAIKSADPDWTEQAKIRADMLKVAGIGQLALKTELKSLGFTDEQIDSVL